MKTDAKTFPPQKISMFQKDEKWGRDSLDAIISRRFSGYTGGQTRTQRIRIEQDLYEGIFDENDLKYVTDPFKQKDSFPATPQNMNIIRSKINLLLGEFTKRPQSMSVVQTNDQVITDLEQEIKDTILDYFTSLQTPDMADEDLSKLEEQIDSVKNKYYNPAEKAAQHTLNYLKYALNMSDELLRNWKDYLINSEMISYVGIRNGMPFFERVDPKYCEYDNDPELRYIEDGDWFVRRMPMTPTAIYDRFYDIMESSDLDELLKMTEGHIGTNNTGSSVNTKSIMWRDRAPFDVDRDQELGYNLINVWHGTWKSYKKVGFLVTLDEDGNEEEVIVDENYKANPDEQITWDWIIEVWEGYRIGDDLYVGVQPVEYQHVSIDNPNAQKLPYVGIPYKQRSLVNIMKPLQYMHIILWYRIELAMARDKGKVLTMDITQIPKSMDIDTNRWLHMLSALGVNLVNPYEEGWDIPGREGGKPSSFNQISALDLSMQNVIVGYIELMNKIEDMLGELSGVTKQREGSIANRELVGNVERSVIQSSHITEPLFYAMNQFVKHSYTMLLDTAKYAWANYDKEKLYYVLPDATRVFLKISEDFLYSDFDVFVNDPTLEDRNIESLKSLLQPAMQNGATLSDAAMILTMNNINDIKSKLQEIDKRREQMMQQQQESEQQVQQMIEQSKQEMELEKLRVEEEKSIRDNQTKIDVELIKQQAQDGSEAMRKLELEKEKINLQRTKINNDKNLKQQELAIKRKQANKPVSNGNS